MANQTYVNAIARVYIKLRPNDKQQRLSWNLLVQDSVDRLKAKLGSDFDEAEFRKITLELKQ